MSLFLKLNMAWKIFVQEEWLEIFFIGYRCFVLWFFLDIFGFSVAI
jgi:hypothetical protein